MLKGTELFHLPYYEKAHFTGSIDGMRFLIEKAAENETPLLKAWIFPGPFCFEKTEDRLKESKTFPFAEESLPLICDWLNRQYEERAKHWHRHKTFMP